MKIEFKAAARAQKGTGASRRLRRAGELPGVVYGGEQAAVAVTLDHNELFHLLRREAFHSSVLSINIDGKSEMVVLRDTQWHPFKQQVLHVDFLRVKAGEKLNIKVPLHFINAENSPAVKLSSGMVSHIINEIDISCLPKDLPEFVEVDLKDLQEDQSVHLSELVLPEGVEVIHNAEGDPVVVTVLKTGGGSDDSAEESTDSAAE